MYWDPLQIENIDTLIYCPGSINLKPIGSLSEDFRNDFEINVIGAVKTIQKYLPDKKGTDPSIVLFSTVAVKLGMPFHASIATAKAGNRRLSQIVRSRISISSTHQCNCSRLLKPLFQQVF
jgi:NAD(P)-dependent dehydrogenase (short-subunit alcohol dehydrogenase family)